MTEHKTNHPALEKAIRILDLLTESDIPLSGANIAKQLDLPRSSVHGLLMSLSAARLLRKTDNNLFMLGPHLMHWAGGFLAKQDIVADFQKTIAGIPQLQPYTLTLSVLVGDQVMYLACRNSNTPLGFTFRTGMQLPAAFTATGKAILSTFDEADVENIIREWPKPLTNNSVSCLPDLLAELNQARMDGYALDNGQVRLGMHCLGAALSGAQNERYGIAVSLTEQEADADTVAWVAEALKDLVSKLASDSAVFSTKR